VNWWSGTTNVIVVHPRFRRSEGRGLSRTLDCPTLYRMGCGGSGLGWGRSIGTVGGRILACSLWWSARSNIAASMRSVSSWVGTTVKENAGIGWRRASVEPVGSC